MSSRQKKVDESRAATLLGLTGAELRRLSIETGTGETDYENGSAQLTFTYAELYRLCRMAAQLTTQ
jgi:hypothetical protein